MPNRDKRKVEQQATARIESIPIRMRPEHLELARKKERAAHQVEEKSSSEVRDFKGVYIISVASRLLEMHPQTLRKYERLGLVRPSRTIGMLRLYSEEDIARLLLIKHLVVELGLNLAGVQLATRLFNKLLETKAAAGVLEGRALKGFVEDSVDQMLALMKGE